VKGFFLLCDDKLIFVDDKPAQNFLPDVNDAKSYLALVVKKSKEIK